MKNLFTVCLSVALLIFLGLACDIHPAAEKTYQNENPRSDNAVPPGGNNSGTAAPAGIDAPDNSAPTGNYNADEYDADSKTLSGGVLNGKAKTLVKPAYPPAAKSVRANGAVHVQVTIDEKGDVVSANAVVGHPLLRASAIAAARQSKFSTTLLSGRPVKVRGVIVYNFTPE